MTIAELKQTRINLLAIAKSTTDDSKATWCRTFAANLGLALSDGEEPRERGMRMLRTNADLCERLYLGAKVEHVRDMACHSDTSQTFDYSRANKENTHAVQRIRAGLT